MKAFITLLCLLLFSAAPAYAESSFSVSPTFLMTTTPSNLREKIVIQNKNDSELRLRYSLRPLFYHNNTFQIRASNSASLNLLNALEIPEADETGSLLIPGKTSKQFTILLNNSRLDKQEYYQVLLLETFPVSLPENRTGATTSTAIGIPLLISLSNDTPRLLVDRFKLSPVILKATYSPTITLTNRSKKLVQVEGTLSVRNGLNDIIETHTIDPLYVLADTSRHIDHVTFKQPPIGIYSLQFEGTYNNTHIHTTRYFLSIPTKAIIIITIVLFFIVGIYLRTRKY